jgi:hypothetical protein
MHNWNTFDAWTNHGHTRTHKTHHDLGLGGSHDHPTYSVLCNEPQELHSNVILSWGSQVESHEIPKIESSRTLEGHNFLCKPLIKVRSEAKLQPLSKTFQ